MKGVPAPIVQHPAILQPVLWSYLTVQAGDELATTTSRACRTILLLGEEEARQRRGSFRWAKTQPKVVNPMTTTTNCEFGKDEKERGKKGTPGQGRRVRRPSQVTVAQAPTRCPRPSLSTTACVSLQRNASVVSLDSYPHDPHQCACWAPTATTRGVSRTRRSILMRLQLKFSQALPRPLRRRLRPSTWAKRTR